MRIAITALGTDLNDDTPGLLQMLAGQKKEHEFVIFTDSTFPSFQNMSVQVVDSPVTSLLSKRWWLDVKLPAALKKYKPDIVIDLAGDASLRTTFPQLLFITGTMFIHHPKQFSSAELLFRQFYLPKYFKRAKAIAVPSDHVKADLVQHFKIPAPKINVVHSSMNSLTVELDSQQKEQVKDEHTEGREYFLYDMAFQPGDRLITLLKAFSRFKKWQLSNMKLVVTGQHIDDDLTAKLNTYKYRDDVVMLKDPGTKQNAALLAAAYAFIHIPLYDGHGSAVIAAMRSGTPVIAADDFAIPEVGGDAVLYVEASNEEMIAAEMIRLYKDETLRSKLAEAGKLQAEKYDDHASAEQLWQLISNIVAGKSA